MTVRLKGPKGELASPSVQCFLTGGSATESPRRRRAPEIGALFVFALALRLAFIMLRGPVVSPDTLEYVTLAQNLVSHGIFSLDTSAPFESSIRRAPVYPSFLALLMWLGVTSPGVMASSQAILDAGVTLVVLFLGEAMFAGKWAKVAAWMYALHPGSILASVSLLSETVFTVLLAAAVWSLVVGLQKNRQGLIGIAGIGLGLAILCRPVALLLPAAIAIVLHFARGIRRPTASSVILLGTVALVLCPWVVRSSSLANRFVPVQAYGAVNFYVATRMDWDWRKETFWWRQVWDDFGMGSARTPREMADLDRWFMRHAFQNIASNSYGYLVSRAKAFPFLFLMSFDKFTGINESFSEVIARADLRRLLAKGALLVVLSLIPVSLAIVGMANSDDHPIALVSAIFWIYTMGIHAPTFFENRYWWPAIPFVLVSGAIGMSRVASRLARIGDSGRRRQYV